MKAVKRFLAGHPDVFDFITFYVDTASGLPGQGSWHRGVFNTTTGINYYAGASLNQRPTYGSQRLMAFHSISGFGNYVLLQETGHMWGAFVRNRDTQAGANRYDLLISNTGQGLFHWGRFFDNDHSPMDYDGVDWEPLAGNQFQLHGIGDNFFHFHPLDLYLMGLIPPEQVGQFYVIQNPSGNSGTITGTRKDIAVQNVVWAEGPRNPASAAAQKVWKQAFVVLTKDARSVRTFAEQTGQQRRRFTWEFFKGTRYLGKVDTTLTAGIYFPEIRDIVVAADNDRAFVGWKTNLSTKGRVNYATTSGAFRRDQAHTQPFSTVAESTFGYSHGVLLTGLTPNTRYYFEVIAETEAGLLDRKGVEQLYTRRTNDTCPPDINNVSVQRSALINNKIFVTWQTDESADSTVRYGTSNPPAQQMSDPYPTTAHSITLTGLAVGTYFISVESRDAAGNLTVDNNSGSFYQVIIPPSAPSLLDAVNRLDVARQIVAINGAIKQGDISLAMEQTSHLIADVAKEELAHIGTTMELPDDDLDAGHTALAALVQRLESAVTVVERNGDYLDLAVSPDPLLTLACVNLPGDLVAHECGHPVLSTAIASLRPGLVLEAHPTRGVGHYRLSRA